MVIISNGQSKFILATAAVEAHRAGLLDEYITGGYPSPVVRRLARSTRLDRLPSVSRLLARKEELPENVVRPIWSAELLGQLAQSLRRSDLQGVADRVDRAALQLYGARAARIIRSVSSRIYHYRAGYGQSSVRAAKRRGMVALCDHSLVHPALLQYLVENDGHLPAHGVQGPMTSFWRTILEDIDQSDHVVVNSDFVRSTFLHQGWREERVHVAYNGVDDAFLDVVPPRESLSRARPLRFLFAGEFGLRKGAHILIEALSRLKAAPWELDIVGTIDPGIWASYATFLRSPRVRLLGFVPRLRLAALMTAADVFVFPSLAEGSARVNFMAMACGCYVITTPNSGSIVRDGIDGTLVPPGDATSLEQALRDAIVRRDEVHEGGRLGAAQVRRHSRQRDYGDALRRIYKVVVSKPSRQE